MKNSISTPYISNNLFSANNSLTLDNKILNSFNSIYNKVRFEKKMNSSIVETLNSLFESIKSENKIDSEMKFFLEELKDKCIEILKNDLMLSVLNEKYRGKKYKNPEKTILKGLKKNNYFILQLNNDIVNKILKLSDIHLQNFEEKRKLLKNTREELSINQGFALRKIISILNKEFKEQGVLDAMSLYIGFPVKVGGCALELSVHEATWHNVNYYKGSNAKTKYFHHDESATDPKAIVYLSDVKRDNGPVSYLDETNIQLKINGLQNLVGRAILIVGREKDSKLYNYYNMKNQRPFENTKFREHFSQLPNEMKHNSHFGWDMVINSKEEKLLLQNEKKVIGPKGTSLIFDGSRLLHRGGIVESDKKFHFKLFSNTQKA